MTAMRLPLADPPVVEASNLTRNFGPLRALDKVSFEIGPGRIVALLGPNGAGKTTLLRLCLGLLMPTTGTVRLLGLEVPADEAGVMSEIAAMGEAWLPPRRTALWHLMTLQAAASPRFDSALAERFCRGVSPDLTRRFGTLSRGQQRWVLAGLTLATRAKLLFFDEPADGLDPAARHELYDELRDYVNATDATIVVATHIISDMERVADEVAILHRGCMALHEDLETLRETVCQAELPPGVLPGDIGHAAQVLASASTDGGNVVWLRRRDAATTWEELLFEQLGVYVEAHPVGLEDLYLALTRRVHRTPQGVTL